MFMSGFILGTGKEECVNVFTNNSQFLQQAVNSSKTMCLWTFPLTQYPAHMCEVCQELLNDYLKYLISSWMQLSPFVMKEVSHVFSCLFRQVYINQCKFHIINSSHSTCTACTTTYYRFFNIWNKWLKCTYVHLCLFHLKCIQYSTLKSKTGPWTSLQ